MYDIKDYIEAATVEEAIDCLKKSEDAMIIAGGTDILIKSRERKEGYTGKILVGITRIPGLKDIVRESNGDIVIGAASSFTSVEESPIIKEHTPLLVQAAGAVGGPQIRNMGTIGGNICNGVTSADSAAPLVALNAILVVAGDSDERKIPIKDFFLGPGRVDLRPHEILKSIRIPQKEYIGYNGHYIKYARRSAMDIAIMGCAVQIKSENDLIEDLRIALGVAAPTPIRMTKAEEFGNGKVLSDEVLAKVGALCLKESHPRDSWRASKAFRESLIEELPQRAIRRAIGKEEVR